MTRTIGHPSLDPGPSMRVEVDLASPRPVVRVSGEIDQDTVKPLRGTLIAALTDSENGLTIDTTDVTFTDTTGLQALLAVRRRAQAMGRPLLLRPGPVLERLLELTDTGQLFTVDRPPPAGQAHRAM